MIASKQVAVQSGSDAESLCFTAAEPNVTISMKKVGSPASVLLRYSYDDSKWESFEVGVTSVVLKNEGDKVYIRSSGENKTFSQSTSKLYTFVISGLVNCSGSVVSLLGINEDDRLPSYCFCALFKGCSTLLTPPRLPSTNVNRGCYYEMFRGCSSLMSVPELPSTSMYDFCYRGMFIGCSSITKPMKLPASILASYCYFSMFERCSSLNEAPELPALSLYTCCYDNMFYYCTSLTKGPDLPAKRAAYSCYHNMFGYSGLTSAPDIALETTNGECCAYMLQCCPNLKYGAVPKPTALSSTCYKAMFYNCPNLESDMVLEATTLASNCYQIVFALCPKIKKITTKQTSFTGCGNWVSGHSSEGTFVCPTALGTNETISRGISACPTGWTVINQD